MEFLASAPVCEIDVVDQAAIDHEECSICMDPLYLKQVSFLTNNSLSKRTCRHYFHSDCIANTNKTCPICRCPYHHHKQLADPRKDANQFFKDIDVDNSNSLSFEEITEGLKATLPFDFRDIESDIDKFWSRWDLDKNGSITLNEFIDLNNGPMHYISQSFKAKVVKHPPPLINSTKSEWFHFFDEDNSNSLDRGEVVRALIKTFKFQQRDDIASQIRSNLDAIWCIFDHDGSGTIEMNEFIQADGLADTVIVTVATL